MTTQDDRTAAIRAAFETMGDPKHHRDIQTAGGTPTPAKGFRGVMGQTDKTGGSTSTTSTYTDDLIQVAEYLVSGQLNDKDVSDLMFDIDDDDYPMYVDRLRYARGLDHD
jgi:hypothetical protein